MCANHIHDIKAFFKGHQLTITARTEDEVDVDAIMEKIDKMSSSSVISERTADFEEDIGPVVCCCSIYRILNHCNASSPLRTNALNLGPH